MDKHISPVGKVKDVERKALNKLKESNAGKKLLSEQVKESVPIPSEPVTCLNCGFVHQNRYCPQCGQASNIKRFNWKGVFQNVTKGLLNTDHGFLFTIKGLFIRPGKVIKDYLAGARVKYFPPYPSMFIVAGLYAIINKFNNFAKAVEVDEEALGVISKELSKESGKTVDLASDNASKYVDFIEDLFADNFGLLILLATPLFVVALRSCFGKNFRAKYNWAESFIISGFVNTQSFVVLTVFAIIVWLFPSFGDNSNILAVILSLVLLVCDMRPFTNITSKSGAVWRSILTYIFFLFLIIVAIVILAIIVVALYILFTGEESLTFNLS